MTDFSEVPTPTGDEALSQRVSRALRWGTDLNPVLGVIIREVREQIARDIEAERDRLNTLRAISGQWLHALDSAAAIARNGASS